MASGHHEAMDDQELTEDEVNHLPGDDERDAGRDADDEYDWAR